MDDFLALQDALLMRLRERLQAQRPDVHWLGAADLAEVAEERQLTPAVQVIFRGYRVLESRPDGRAARIEQTWLAVVAVRNVRGLKSGAAARAEAGALAALVLRALLGFKPALATRALRLADAPPAVYSAGHQYLPLAFVAELLVGDV